jgi:hypothetical protein
LEPAPKNYAFEELDPELDSIYVWNQNWNQDFRKK